jgi:LmbE family N-acetylglucosaminyl deacetylase
MVGSASRLDLYLAPHTDDVCFSLGAWACARGAGQLLTVFPRSRYQVASALGAATASADVTRRRLAEDARFAQACGLTTRYLDLPDASARGEPPFEAAGTNALAGTITQPLRAALLGSLLGLAPRTKPLLACPAGIGGHVDHRAVCLAVIDQLPALENVYQVGFYEDLHYASDPGLRAQGLQALAAMLAPRVLQRITLRLDPAQQALKLQLVGLYASQMTPTLRGLAAFTPAAGPAVAPHEAIWMLQPARHQASG